MYIDYYEDIEDPDVTFFAKFKELNLEIEVCVPEYQIESFELNRVFENIKQYKHNINTVKIFTDWEPDILINYTNMSLSLGIGSSQSSGCSNFMDEDYYNTIIKTLPTLVDFKKLKEIRIHVHSQDKCIDIVNHSIFNDIKNGDPIKLTFVNLLKQNWEHLTHQFNELWKHDRIYEICLIKRYKNDRYFDDVDKMFHQVESMIKPYKEAMEWNKNLTKNYCPKCYFCDDFYYCSEYKFACDCTEINNQGNNCAYTSDMKLDNIHLKIDTREITVSIALNNFFNTVTFIKEEPSTETHEAYNFVMTELNAIPPGIIYPEGGSIYYEALDSTMQELKKIKLQEDVIKNEQSKR